MKKSIFAIATLTLLAACSESTTTATVETTEEAKVYSAEDIKQGGSIYASKCSTCHDAMVIDDYSKERWSKILPGMSKKAKLNPNETELVQAYVNSELEN